MDVAQYAVPRCCSRPSDRPRTSSQEENAPNRRKLIQRAIQRATGKRSCVEVGVTPSQGTEARVERPAKAARRGGQESPSDTQERGISCDSMAVVNWMRGIWNVQNLGHQQRVAQIIDYLDNACEKHDCRAPAYGWDIWEHFYRAGNKRADELTWEMRDAP
eukprot:6144333-Pyramimonas_sp.AAC.1